MNACGKTVTNCCFKDPTVWQYNLRMYSKSSGYNPTRETIELAIAIICGAVIIGWTLGSGPRDVRTRTAESNTPEVPAAGTVPSSQPESGPSDVSNPDSGIVRPAPQSVPVALSPDDRRAPGARSGCP